MRTIGVYPDDLVSSLVNEDRPNPPDLFVQKKGTEPEALLLDLR
jgi:hypothetical protein